MGSASAIKKQFARYFLVFGLAELIWQVEHDN